MTSSIQLAVAENDIAVGRARFTFGLLDNNHPINKPSVRVLFYSVHGNTATVRQIATARFSHFAKGLKDNDQNAQAVELQGVYVTYPTFKTAGLWMVEARLQYRGKLQDVRQGFQVAKHSLSPAIGSPAPRSNNPTVRQMPVAKLDSGRPPDDMHRLSIAQAIAEHKPLVVLFSTPGFCTSRMCGPQTEIVQQLEKRYRGRVNFVHIEVYKNANPRYGLAPTMTQWHLQTEPWVFVINRRGIVSAKFEGPTAGDEIVPAIQKVLRG